MRESKALLQGLAEVTRERHAKHGMTLYHLEPNLKEAPGGLRDYNVACWLALISAMDKLHDWPHASSLREPIRKQMESALDFLMAARCFLHFRCGRDDNTLSWEAQDEAAAHKIGAADAEVQSAADWMRIRPDGVGLVQVLGCIETRTGARVYTSYGGIVDLGRDGYARALRGESNPLPSFVGAPTFATADKGLEWLNRAQCLVVGRVDMKALRVEYDAYAIEVGATKQPIAPSPNIGRGSV